MDFALTKEEKQLQADLRAFFRKEATPEVWSDVFSPENTGPHYSAMLKKMAAKGWWAYSWPREYGGLGGSQIGKYLVRNEINFHFRAWIGPPTGSSVVGPTLLLYGSEEQKKKWLPPVSRLDIEFALGYTEPQAGSDLAGLQIRAEERGDFYLVNGQKTFNGAAHRADYHWLLARTDPSVAKHKGISLFMVDLKSPGIEVRPLWCMDGHRANEVFYDNVMVPKANMVGAKNQGWSIVTAALAFERQYPTGMVRGFLNALIEYVKDSSFGGKRLSDDPLVMQKIADREIELQVYELLAFRVPWMSDQKQIPLSQAPMAKCFGAELCQRVADTAMDILGMYQPLTDYNEWSRRKGEPGEGKWVQMNSEAQDFYMESRRQTIVAGASEIQRNIVAIRGLGMPH